MLDLFAVPGDLRPLPGGQGLSVLAGDLVLSPGRDRAIADRLNPHLARMAVRLDTRPRRDVRIAMPIPARDGTWVVDGWSASRYEPGSRACTDAAVVRATGALLHAQFAQAFAQWPLATQPPRSRWDRAERIAFGDGTLDAGEFTDAQAQFAQELLDQCTDEAFGDNQLVHGDLAGNVLLDAAEVPVVIDVAPYWRPVRWADAVCVLDLVLWAGADPALIDGWADGPLRQAMLRAAIFRVLSDPEPDEHHVARYRAALARP
ncbi:MAG TPA: aminoglycoside phosphotransferase [Flexivirga sp.]|uniref:aminoglycoside phosphotransferase n=1 Tax=Flexivirga sp. TaxID=1962927 RepID=UPI002B66763E|nr:aminoglycoside phosphotransferase [Flexivirga sp.]HWC24202.1 aminoglycoside phosphotransferase [Flexivirga sp.]